MAKIITDNARRANPPSMAIVAKFKKNQIDHQFIAWDSRFGYCANC